MARLPSYKLTEYAYDYEHCIGPSRRKGRAAALLRGEPLCAEEVYEKIAEQVDHQLIVHKGRVH